VLYLVLCFIWLVDFLFMYNSYRLIFVALLLLCAVNLSAQVSIRGRVTDEDGRPISAALLRLPTHGTGVISDSLGQFVLPICGDCGEGSQHLLEVSYIGYQSRQLKVSASTPSPLKIELREAELQAVEVLAHGLDNLQSSNTSREDLARNRQGSLAASLDRVAGLNSINVGVGIAKPVIRGLSGSRVSIQHDGTKQEGQQWGGDHGLEIDALDVSRLQLIKGAASLRYGSDALGGVLIIASAEAPTRARFFAANIESLYKTNNQHGAISAQFTARRNRFWAQGRYSLQSFGDYRLPADKFTYNGFQLPIYDNQLKNTAGREESARFTVGYIAPKSQNKLQITSYKLDAGIFLGAVGQPRAYNLQPDGNSRDRQNPRQHVEHLKISNENVFFPHPDWHLHLQAAYQRNLRQEYSFPETHNRPLSAENNNLALALLLQTFSANVWAEYSKNSQYTHTLGAQAEAQNNKSTGFEFLIPAFQRQQIGFYYLLDYRPNAKNQISAGVRGDFYQLQTQDFFQLAYANRERTATYMQQRARALSRDFLNYAAAVTWTYQPKASQLFQLQFGKTFRAPTINELASDGIHHGTFRHERGDSSLLAEQGFQLDAAYRYHRRRYSISAAAFGNYFLHYIYLRPSARFSPLPEGGQVYQYSQHNALFAGGEIELAAIPFANLPNLRISQAYECVYNYNLNTKLPLPFTPPVNILTELQYEATFSAKMNGFVSLSHSYFFAQNRVDRNEAVTPNYHLFHAAAGFSFAYKGQKISFNLQARNILNTPYLQHLSRYRQLNLPEQGRDIVLSLRLDFGA
jgi:iron complex outermembrane receptor protein